MRLLQTFLTLVHAGMMLASCGSPAANPRVVAASSIARLMTECGLDRNVTVVRGASKTLEKQLLEGLTCDVVILLSPIEPMGLLAAHKIAPDTLRELGTLRLSLASSPSSPIPTSINDLRILPGRIALANPETAPFGIAAKEALTRAGLWESLHSRIVITDDVGLAEKLVAEGEVAFAVVPFSERGSGRHLPIAAELHQPLRAWGALSTSASPEATAWWQRLTARQPGDALELNGLSQPSPRATWSTR